VQRLFAILRQLRAQGLSIIYISHFLEELEQIADSVTVLRDGRTAGAGPLSRWPRPRIIEAMVGRGVDQMYVRVPHAIGPQLLRIDGLSGRPLPRSANLVLHQGEILGIAGLVGAGRTQMLRALFGLDPAIGGTAWVAGVRVAHFRPSIWMRRGMCLLSEDRKTEGLAQGLSCRANMTLPVLGRMSRLGFVRAALERRESRRIGRRLGVRWDGPDQPVGSLSGGNQQKVAMARLLLLDADVLLLDEPTRGIDVAAKVDLYRAIGELAARGKGIVVVSSYVPELLGICDRIAVMSRGVLSEAFETARMSARRIMQLAVGEYGSDSI
jgi:ribose transport system ATP-binding protein